MTSLNTYSAKKRKASQKNRDMSRNSPDGLLSPAVPSSRKQTTSPRDKGEALGRAELTLGVTVEDIRRKSPE